MKTIILMIAIMGLVLGSYAQDTVPADVPQAALKSFTKKYPKAEQVTWSKTGDFYKASYTYDNSTTTVVYDESGKLKQNETQVRVSQLPTLVLKYVNDNYPSDVVKKSSKVTTAAGKSTYVVKVKDSELVFDSNGKYLESLMQ